jgi:hypothetical protein
METKTKVAIILLVLFSVCPAKADIVELDLFSLGCPTEFNVNKPEWTTELDLGVEFIEINNVYINWSGEIYACLVQGMDDPEPMPGNGSLLAYFGWLRRAEVRGGWATYPNPEQFDVLSEFQLLAPGMTWNNLLDGKEAITIDYPAFNTIAEISVIDYGSAVLNGATLVVDGTIIPEPATVLLIGLGCLFVLEKR